MFASKAIINTKILILILPSNNTDSHMYQGCQWEVINYILW